MQQRRDDSAIRAAATNASLPCITALAGIRAVVSALTSAHKGKFGVKSLQGHHERAKTETVRSTVPY